MLKRKYRLTLAQGKTLSILRMRLAERGYFIFSLSPALQRHRQDFLATPKAWQNQFVVVHPMSDGSITIRPYCTSVLYGELRALIGSLEKKFPAPVKWRDRLLPFAGAERDWREKYLPKGAQSELMLLTT